MFQFHNEIWVRKLMPSKFSFFFRTTQFKFIIIIIRNNINHTTIKMYSNEKKMLYTDSNL